MREFEVTIQAIALCIQAQVPVLTKGPPGVGKTALMGALMEALCDRHHVSIAALHEPTEYGGFPVPHAADQPGGKEYVAFVPTSWQLRLAGADRRAGLMLDELSNAPPATRAAAMRGIHEHVWGETEISKLSTVAAMNPPDIAESGYELSAPLANRFCHVDWNMPADFWLDQLMADFPPIAPIKLPANWREEQLPRAKAAVIGFGKARPAALQALPNEAALRAGAWPSYRSWTMAIELLAACLSIGETFAQSAQGTGLSPLVQMLVVGCVGGAAATEFFTYWSTMDLPDPEALLRDPDQLVLPERGDKVHAILAAVVAAVVGKNTPERWATAMEIMGMASDQGKADIAAAAVRTIAMSKYRPEPIPARAAKSIFKFQSILKQAGLLKQ